MGAGLTRAAGMEVKMFCKCKTEEAGRKKHHCCRKMLFLGIAAAAAYAWYSQQDESKKRFIKHLARQVPYLPGRYYA